MVDGDKATSGAAAVSVMTPSAAPLVSFQNVLVVACELCPTIGIGTCWSCHCTSAFVAFRMRRPRAGGNLEYPWRNAECFRCYNLTTTTPILIGSLDCAAAGRAESGPVTVFIDPVALGHSRVPEGTNNIGLTLILL